MKKSIWTPRVFLIFFMFFERILYKSNCIIFILSWCGTHTKIRSKLVVIVTAGSQKITLWGRQRTPLGILRVNKDFSWSVLVYGAARLPTGEICILRVSPADVKRAHCERDQRLHFRFCPHQLEFGVWSVWAKQPRSETERCAAASSEHAPCWKVFRQRYADEAHRGLIKACKSRICQIEITVCW